MAHRLSTVINADQIAVLDKGRIAELGSHDALLEKNGVYAKLGRKQIAKRASLVDEEAFNRSAAAEKKTAGTGAEKKKKKRKKSDGDAETEIDSLFDEVELE